jgi:hypothetical protein
MPCLALLLATRVVAAEPAPPPTTGMTSSVTSTASASVTPAGAPSSAASDDVVASLGATLSSLRAEVDAAAGAVAQARRAADDDIAALHRRQRELEARLAQSELTVRELQAREAALAAAGEQADTAARQARAPVDAALAGLQVLVERVPFRTHSRRERIEAARLASVDRAPAEAAALVWPIVVDEAALLNDVARARQPIDVGGTQIIAEVAHVGPLVFWKAKDGRVGTTAPGDGASRFVEVTDAEGRQRLQLFFETLRRGAPSGVLLVPNPLAGNGNGGQR